MTGEPAGQTGAEVARLMNTIVSWALNPEGYQKMTREQKLNALEEAIDVALENKAYGALDLLWVEYRKLRAHG